MRWRYISILICCFFILVFSWFYGIVFCGVYKNTGDMWIWSSVTGVMLGVVGLQCVAIPLFFLIMRIVVNSNRKKKYYLKLTQKLSKGV
jgi:hypothetical protein